MKRFPSPAQLAILRHLACGLSNQEIAERQQITVGTTKWYLHVIYQELGVPNRCSAVAKAHVLGLL